MSTPDAVVVGAGPNGLAAAVALARAGLSVLVLEAEPTIGGGARSAELTLPGFTHDVCSAIHPFAYASPFFRRLPLEQFGLQWVHPPAPLAHPVTEWASVVLQNSLQEMVRGAGDDGPAYESVFGPARDALRVLSSADNLFAAWPKLIPEIPLALQAMRSVESFASRYFRSETVRALLAGCAAHSMLPLETAGTAAIAIGLLAAGHAGGWPFPRGGAQKIADSLGAYLQSLGGRIETGQRVRDIRDLPPARAILLDVTPRQVIAMAGALLPERYVKLLGKFRYGIGAFKMDWALSAPVPWCSPEIVRAGVIHIGGTLEEIANAERAPWQGGVAERPFVIAAQHSLFDPTRAPEGKHTLWAYCHVPLGSEIDMTEQVERQIERFAPGFRDCILARSVLPPRVLEQHNENLAGGDITGGRQDLFQSIMRPTLSFWKTPLNRLYICSSSTPPGVGVHGMCGYLAAQAALRRSFGIRPGEAAGPPEVAGGLRDRRVKC